MTNYFNYTCKCTDEKIVIELKHHCDEECNTKDIKTEIIKDGYDTDDTAVTLLDKMIFDKDEVITTLLHDMHDLILIKQSMVRV